MSEKKATVTPGQQQHARTKEHQSREIFVSDIPSLSSVLRDQDLEECEKKDADGFCIHRGIKYWVRGRQ